MPQSAKQKNDHGITHGPKLSASASAKGNIDICREKAAERDVPFFPKITDGHRLIRGIKIVRQFHTEHFSKTDRHITIAAEIKIELQHIRKCRKRQRYGIQAVYVRKAKVRRLGKHIRK